MKKNDYQTPEMEVVKLNKMSTLLTGSCTTQCDTDGGGGGSCVVN